MVDKIVSLEDAMALVGDNDTVCVSGFVGIGTPQALIRGLKDRFSISIRSCRTGHGLCAPSARPI